MAPRAPSGPAARRGPGARPPRGTLPVRPPREGRVEGAAGQVGANGGAPWPGARASAPVSECWKERERPREGGGRGREPGKGSGGLSCAPGRPPREGASGGVRPAQVPGCQGGGGGGQGRTGARLRALPPAASPPRLGDGSASPGPLTPSSPPRSCGPARALCSETLRAFLLRGAAPRRGSLAGVGRRTEGQLEWGQPGRFRAPPPPSLPGSVWGRELRWFGILARKGVSLRMCVRLGVDGRVAGFWKGR